MADPARSDELDASPWPDVTHPKRRAFLAAFARCGSVGDAARASGVTETTPYSDPWQRDAAFVAGWEMAERIWGHRLEREADRRAARGLRRYKFDRDGRPIPHPERCICRHHVRHHVVIETSKIRWKGTGERRTEETITEHVPGPCVREGCECQRFHGRPYYEHEFSDGLLQLRLRATKPEKYREQSAPPSTGPLVFVVGPGGPRAVEAVPLAGVVPTAPPLPRLGPPRDDG